MSETIHILYIDRYHQGDALFLQALARALSQRVEQGLRVVIVHGGGELAERRLEAEGYEVQRVDRVLDVRSTHEVEIVERAIRESNQQAVTVLTDNAVHAVGLQGVDKGLLRLREDGRIYAANVSWVQDLAAKRAVPVVSALVRDVSSIVRQADPAAVAASLAEAFGWERANVVFFTKDGRPINGSSDAGGALSIAELPGGDLLPEPDAVRLVAERGAPVTISRITQFAGGQGVVGTPVVA